MSEARTLILQRIRARLNQKPGQPAPSDPAKVGHAGRPAGPHDPASLAARFAARATALGSEVEHLAQGQDVSLALQTRLASLPGPDAFVAWPALTRRLHGGAYAYRNAEDGDRIGVTGCAAAIAETGSLVLTSGPTTPASVSLLPDIHVALVATHQLVADFESAWDKLRGEPDWPPRGVTLVSGPSRTADIEQQVVVGAHGPSRVIILLYAD